MSPYTINVYLFCRNLVEVILQRFKNYIRYYVGIIIKIREEGGCR